MSHYESREYDIDDPELPKLFLQSWTNKSVEPIGCVLITHGIAEHSDCYQHVAKALSDHGWFVYGWDLQGHGRSQGKRGYIKNFTEYSRDLVSLVKKIKQDETKPTHNFHLLGHSMGGLITLQSLLSEGAPRVQSAILSNPALKIAVEVPKVKEIASQWLNQLWPTMTLNNEVRYDRLSRDPEMVRSYSKDPLRHNKVSAPLFLGMMEAMEFVHQNIERLKHPVYFQISGQDQIVDPQTSLDLFKEIPGEKKLDLYPDSFHEIYNDINKQEGIDDLIAYLGEYKA